MYPQKNKSHRNRLIAMGVAGLLLVVILIVSLNGRSTKHQAPSGSVTTKYDPNSGETTRNIKGESNTATPDAPIYLGVSALLDRGVSSNQLTNMETGFYRYSTSQTPNIKQISISVNSIKTRTLNQNSDNPVNVIDFGVVFDGRISRNASLHYSGLNDTELFIYDNGGTQLYDSGLLSAGGPSGD